MGFEIHREPLYRRYYTTCGSASCCYTMVYVFALILLPLIIAYNSSGFWLKESIYFEQPDIRYKYDTIFQCVCRSSSTGEMKQLYYSTSSAINQVFASHLRMPLLTSIEQDNNRDGITDSLELNIQMPLALDEDVIGVDVLLLHRVKLSNRAKYVFDSATYIHHDSPYPFSKLFVEGNAMLHQKWSLTTKGGYRVLDDGSDLLPTTQFFSADAVSIPSIMRRVLDKNLTIHFEETFKYADASSLAVPYGTSVKLLNTTVIQHIPIQAIRYTPPVSEVLKYAWIQYISFFAVTSFLLFRLNSFIFRHQLLYSKPVADVVVEKID